MKETFLIKRNGRTFYAKENGTTVVFTDNIEDLSTVQEFDSYAIAQKKIKELIESPNEHLANGFYQIEKYFRKENFNEAHGPFIVGYLSPDGLTASYVSKFTEENGQWQCATTLTKDGVKEYPTIEEARYVAALIQEWQDEHFGTEPKIQFLAMVKDIKWPETRVLTHTLRVDEMPSQDHGKHFQGISCKV